MKRPVSALIEIQMILLFPGIKNFPLLAKVLLRKTTRANDPGLSTKELIW